MLFNSYIFIFLFLPLCLAGFYILQNKNATLAKVWLTCFSLWFYGYFNLTYLWIMLGSIIGNYFVHGKIMEIRNSCQGEERKVKSKRVMITGVIINLLVLFYFKYYDFFVENINLVSGSNFALKHILLPLGISFFTFQQISFLVDTYRGELDRYGEKKFCVDKAGGNKDNGRISFIDYSLFVSFFPQLIAGPIVIHEEMMPQFARIGKDDRTKEEKLTLFTKGVYVFVLGLAKKVLIADTFGIAVDYAYSNVSGINGLESFLTIIFYSLQLYFDFSGYCDMAKGIAGMFGMQIAGNFNSPYKASDIVDFWKRWHITLSRFFTKNIYIPLGGNRKGKVRMYVNYLMVFFLSGLWHGAGWNFILWGLYFGVLLVIEKFWLGGYLKRARIWNHIYVLFFIVISFVIFDGTDSGRLVYYLKAMFGGAGLPVISKELLYYLRHYGLLILTACGASLPYGKKIYMRVKESFRDNKLFEVAESMGILILLLIVTAYLVDGSFNPFLYFRF